MTIADEILSRALMEVGLNANASPSEKFARVYGVIEALRLINNENTIQVGTTGTISDRICEWALQVVGADIYYRLTKKDVKWLGDYGLLGYPLNLIISVKSFKAKERLLMSGTGSQLVPTIGFGLFDDPKEFSAARLVSNRLRGFLAIYMPSKTMEHLSQQSLAFLNWNSTVLLRPLEFLPSDLNNAIIEIDENRTSRRFIDSLKI